MLLDARTLDLAPRAPVVLAATGGDPRFKPELPAAQLEIVLPPLPDVGRAAVALTAARADLAAAAAPDACVAGAGAHPFASPEGVVHPAPRYQALEAEFGAVIRHQLLFGLHIHVAVRPADRALAVYNAMRSHLPELAALGANAPYYAGRDTGLASVRPKIADILPRQGVPPEIPSWEALADYLSVGARVGGDPPAGPVVVRAAPARALRHRGGSRPGHAVDRGRHGRHRRRGPRAGRAAGRPPRRGRDAARRRDLADRREPLGGVPPWPRRGAGRPAQRRRAPGARAVARAAR